MSSWLVAPSGLIEPIPAQEIYVDGIGAIELVNPGTVRIHLVQEQLPIEAPIGIPQKIVVVKLVGPLLCIPQTIGHLAACLVPVVAPVPLRGPRLLK